MLKLRPAHLRQHSATHAQFQSLSLILSGSLVPRRLLRMPLPTLLNLDKGLTRLSIDGDKNRKPQIEIKTFKPSVKPTVKEGTPELSAVERSKQVAAWTAVNEHVSLTDKVIGIGSGSTVPYVVEAILAQGEEVNANRIFLPTGFQSKELIVEAKLTLGDVDQFPSIDITIDGADEVDTDLNCIKGGGACHLREKVLAEAARTWILVADYRKNSEILGTTYKAGIPIEVAPFAYAKLLQNLHHLGSPKAALRMAPGGKAGPVVTDNGNFIIDAPFDEETMQDPHSVLTKIKMLTGVVEVGLFCGMAKAAYFGNPDGTVTVKFGTGDASN